MMNHFGIHALFFGKLWAIP